MDDFAFEVYGFALETLAAFEPQFSQFASKRYIRARVPSGVIEELLDFY